MLLQLLLAFQVVITDPNIPIDCENYAPNHSAGIAITEEQIRPSELEGLYEHIVVPSLSIEWANTAYQKSIVKEFLRITYGRDRRLHLYIKPTNKPILDIVDSITAVMLPTGQFLNQQCQFPDDYKPWEAALCVRENDMLDDFAFANLRKKAAEGWPWLTCRNHAPNGLVPFPAGAEIVSITDWDIKPSELIKHKYDTLEYIVSNVGTKVSTTDLLSRYRHFWDSGAGALEVWYTGGPTARYKNIIERLDRWGSSPLPAVCRKVPSPIPTPLYPYPPASCSP